MRHLDHTYKDGALSKIPAVDVSDERAIDAFTLGLQQGDLVEEWGELSQGQYQN
jgi:hypothetical protein